MQRIKLLIILFIYIVSFPVYAKSHEEKMNTEDKTVVLDSVKKLIKKYYILPEVSQAINNSLHAEKYESIEYPNDFADKVTQDLYRLTKDKHFSVTYSATIIANKKMQSITDFLKNLPIASSNMNFGFNEVRRLNCNIGYLSFDFFGPTDISAKTFDASMEFLQHTEALIIDLRKNIGGDPRTVAYFASYFFHKTPVHLNNILWIKDNKVEEFWTSSSWPMWRYTNKNIYILTSKQTFSAAEEFAYDMQALNRAIVVGEKTAGGANPGHKFRVNDHFSIFIPTGKAVNPVTKTNWEEDGVHPNVLILENHALKAAYELAVKSKPNNIQKCDEKF
jgi:C-terminal processing protease CtpA/Prc